MNHKAPHTFARPRRLALLAMLGWLAAGCANDFDPPSLVDHLRVLAVKADPPYIDPAPAARTTLSTLTVGVASDTPLCHAWSLCAAVTTSKGHLHCVDPALEVSLGTQATATVDAAALATLAQGAAKLGGSGLGGGPPGASGDNTLSKVRLTVMFGVAERAALGGTCPNAPVDFQGANCQDPERCLIGTKSLVLAVSPDDRHNNPKLEPTEVGGTALANGEKTAVKPGAIALLPTWTEDSREPISAAGTDRESLLMSWFSTAGEFDQQRSYDDVPGNSLTLSAGALAGEGARVWVVVRDGRGGTDWWQGGLVAAP